MIATFISICRHDNPCGDAGRWGGCFQAQDLPNSGQLALPLLLGLEFRAQMMMVPRRWSPDLFHGHVRWMSPFAGKERKEHKLLCWFWHEKDTLEITTTTRQMLCPAISMAHCPRPSISGFRHLACLQWTSRLILTFDGFSFLRRGPMYDASTGCSRRRNSVSRTKIDRRCDSNNSEHR